MAKITMRVSLEGQCRNAADLIDRLARKVREAADWDEDRDGDTVDDPADGADAYAHGLREIAAHAKGTAEGLHDEQDFLQFYCLKERTEGRSPCHS